uniref:Wall-associated receptor kinase galacturonan-binding domain-containing protein n=1 Tax=Nelumbo nucifera TaxID=4432 RepID=A0A822YAL8_NELNU|nr:TPA_asm: hypothetical protein HUJ06_030935 [Nelumbo nucifera]
MVLDLVMLLLLLLYQFLVFSLCGPATVTASSSTMPLQAKPNCADKCGNITVPYPFGIGDDPSCYRDGFNLFCNNTFTPPKLFVSNISNMRKDRNLFVSDPFLAVEVTEISLEGQLRVYSFMNCICYDDSFSGTNASPILATKVTLICNMDVKVRNPYEQLALES